MTKKAPDDTILMQRGVSDEPTDRTIARPKSGRNGATPKGAETRGRIIAGTLETLERHGIGAVTTRKIAASAGVQLATLHYHFDSKETLLIAVLEDLIADMVATYRRESGEVGDLDTRLEVLIRSIWRYVGRTREKQLAQLELTLYALRTKGSEWLAATQYAAYVDVYRRLLQAGDDPAEAEIWRALGRFVLCGIDGLILQTFSMKDEAAAEAGLEALIVAARDYLHRLTEESRGMDETRDGQELENLVT